MKWVGKNVRFERKTGSRKRRDRAKITINH